ncbi:GTPase Era involved in 16S rRNA processing [Nocardioides sp. BE266]|uniref:YfjP family GTPase n=1 Tax=Nocardioides sp. BE266 TaxID=2817725 RepID=UPI0028602F47|nr:YfjP family GTPase [Nocardioides sp. BE266]MDR7255281.1 GTPase Era involved in 16S rRNA processing [Nocardioides sp. BE266]
MTSLLEGAKKLVTRSSDIGARVDGLERAAAAARGRVDDAVVDDATAVAARAAGRLRLSADHTVVALAGATGSGKSSTFNALTELELAAVGVRRPTTSWATACVWGKEGAEELLEWLGIPARHQVTRDSMLSKGDEDAEMRGVVLLDLPDHDSTEVSHHLEVERLVRLADMLVWVLDPQKYADAAIHDRFLKPLAGHADVMLVVLNHIDTVPENRRQSMLDDVRRLLEADGLAGVPVLPVSARQGWGVDELRALIVKRVAEKKATRARLEADVRAAAQRLQAEVGSGKAPTLSPERVAALDDAFADAAGVPIVVQAVADSTRIRANRATGWPVTAWFSRLRPDPLKRLHLDLGSSGKELTGTARTSVPRATGVQSARVDREVRALADQVGEGMAPSWATAVRAASVSRLPDLNDRLDRAVSATDLGAAKIPVWAGLVRVLQYLLILSAIVGAGWLALLALGSYARLPEPPTPEFGAFPLPTLLLIGGIGLGLLLALVCRWLVSATAKTRARTADKRLRDAISEVSGEVVVEPIQAELTSYAAVRDGLSAALK